MLLATSLVLALVPLPQDPVASDPAPSAAPAANPFVPSDTWQAIVREGKEQSQVMAILDHLTNRIGPRLTSSDNLTNACEWARDWLKDLGYDNARLDQWGEFPVGFNRGPSQGEISKPESARKALVFITRAWSAGTKGRQTGRAIWAPASVAEAKERAAELAGTWLVRRPAAAPGGGGRRPAAMPGDLSGGATALRKVFEESGALGLVTSGSQFRGRPQDKLENLLMTGGSRQVKWDSLPTFPEIQVRWDQFQELTALVDGPEPVELTFDIRNWFEKGPIPLYNVIADLPGTEHPQEYVIVSGHIDSWDGATGTTDNGTGTATTLEAARILKACGVQPKRTIRFMLWSGEEQGLMGSRAWVQKNREDVLANCQACLVHDGGTNYAHEICGGRDQASLLRRAFQGFAAIDPSFEFKVTEGNQPSGGSDHASFLSIGAPGFYWGQTGRNVYSYGHHTQHDTYDIAIADYQKQTAVVAALGALALANADQRMPPPPRGAQGGRNRTGIEMSDALVVESVVEDSPMGRAGVKKGDKLLEYAGKKLESRDSWREAAMAAREAGATEAKLVVERGGERVELKVAVPQRR